MTQVSDTACCRRDADSIVHNKADLSRLISVMAVNIITAVELTTRRLHVNLPPAESPLPRGHNASGWTGSRAACSEVFTLILVVTGRAPVSYCTPQSPIVSLSLVNLFAISQPTARVHLILRLNYISF